MLPQDVGSKTATTTTNYKTESVSSFNKQTDHWERLSSNRSNGSAMIADHNDHNR